MPHRKPSPPESADMAGMLLTYEEEEGVCGEVVFFPQQITSCFPLASMEQNNSYSPNEAEIGPMVPKELVP